MYNVAYISLFPVILYNYLQMEEECFDLYIGKCFLFFAFMSLFSLRSLGVFQSCLIVSHSRILFFYCLNKLPAVGNILKHTANFLLSNTDNGYSFLSICCFWSMQQNGLLNLFFWVARSYPGSDKINIGSWYFYDLVLICLQESVYGVPILLEFFY